MNSAKPAPAAPGPPALPPPSARQRVSVAIDGSELPAELALPRAAGGLAIFTLGCGCIREAPRAGAIAEDIAAAGTATLTLALLTGAEARKDRYAGGASFDLELLTQRLRRVTDWARQDPRTRELGIGFCGTSTLAAAALVTAAQLGDIVRAVVARAGRPDFAGEALPRVKAPTLLIVGENDETLLELNRRALDRLGGPKRLSIVPRAGHLFEEPGAIEQVGRLAAAWFEVHLKTGRARPARQEDIRHRT